MPHYTINVCFKHGLHQTTRNTCQRRKAHRMSRSTCTKRMANFGKLEESVIVENVNMRSNILFGRFSLQLTAEKKAKAWQEDL